MAEEIFSIAVGGTAYTAWEEISVTAAFDAAARSFRATIAAELGPQATKAVFSAGVPVTIHVGSDLLLTGYVDKYSPSLTATSATISISGRSKSQDAIDCSANHKTGRVEKKDPVEIGRAVLDGIDVEIETDQTLKKVAAYQLTPGETVFRAVEKLARRQGCTVNGTAKGGMKLTRAGTKRHAGGIYEGRNLKTGDSDHDTTNRHSAYTIRGQRAEGHGKGALEIEAKTKDTGVYPQILGTSTIYVDTLNGDDANDGRSTGTALKTVGEAQNRSTRFYQFGRPLLIKLVRSGIYPLPATAPSLSGSLIIQGDPAAQDNYILQGATTGSSASVIGSGGANLTLEGLTVSNLTTGRYTAASSAGGRLTLNRVTLTSTQTLSVSHVYCTGPSTIEIGTNVIWASSASSMLSVRKGEIALTTNSASSVRNNPIWSEAAAVADGGGSIFVRGGATMSGAATGPRYRVGVNATIDAGGAGEEFFRGNQPGTQDTARSGFYIP